MPSGRTLRGVCEGQDVPVPDMASASVPKDHASERAFVQVSVDMGKSTARRQRGWTDQIRVRTRAGGQLLALISASVADLEHPAWSMPSTSLKHQYHAASILNVAPSGPFCSNSP